VILQRHPRLRPTIQTYGCYYMSLLWHGVMEAGFPLDVEMIDEELYNLFQKRRWMTETCFVMDPVEILRYVGVQVRKVKKTGDGYLCKDGEIEVMQFKVGDAMSHFVAGDTYGNVTYDPWGRSASVRDGVCISKRVFTP
jgi:hypothetical protein